MTIIRKKCRRAHAPARAFVKRGGIVLLAAAMSFWAASCAPKSGDSSPETEKDRQDVWIEEADRAVSFVRMHPGAAQKNGYLTWKLFKNANDGREQWRADDRPISDAAAADLKALLDAVASVSAPSDGIYGCRVRDAMPQYRLDFRRDGHDYRVLSVSDCAGGAPFNVIADGEYRIDLTENIGQKLQKALQSSGMTLAVGSVPGMMMLDAPAVISGYDGKGSISPKQAYGEKIREDSEFSAFLAQMTKVFGAEPSIRIACNQAKTADCSSIHAQYAFEKSTMKYVLPLVWSNGSLSYGSPLPPPDDVAALGAFAASPLFAQYAALGDAPAEFAFKPETDCALVRGLAPHMDKNGDVSCAGWLLFGGSRPNAMYFVGLDALWIPSRNSQSWISAVCRWKQLPKQAKSIVCAQSALPAALNVFWRGDGTVYGFETRDGKTKIVK